MARAVLRALRSRRAQRHAMRAAGAAAAGVPDRRCVSGLDPAERRCARVLPVRPRAGGVRQARSGGAVAVAGRADRVRRRAVGRVPARHAAARGAARGDACACRVGHAAGRDRAARRFRVDPRTRGGCRPAPRARCVGGAPVCAAPAATRLASCGGRARHHDRAAHAPRGFPRDQAARSVVANAARRAGTRCARPRRRQGRPLTRGCGPARDLAEGRGAGRRREGVRCGDCGVRGPA